jgi:hypothetical protein
MNNKRIEIFKQLEKGLILEKRGYELPWCTDLEKLVKYSETYRESDGKIEYLFFGEDSVLGGISLGLYTPFDTMRDNNGVSTLNHLGQNLNEETLSKLIEKLVINLGKPDYESLDYGKYLKWEDDYSYIEIIPRSHHGSDWNAIIVGTKDLHKYEDNDKSPAANIV